MGEFYIRTHFDGQKGIDHRFLKVGFYLVTKDDNLNIMFRHNKSKVQATYRCIYLLSKTASNTDLKTTETI